MDATRIKQHMKVVGSDNSHVGAVDCVKNEKVILTKSDPAAGGKHHAIPLEWVGGVEENEARLNQTGDDARANWSDAENADGQSGAKPCP